MPAFLKNNYCILKGIFALFLIMAFFNAFAAVAFAKESNSATDAVNAAIGTLDQTAGNANIIKLEDNQPAKATPKIATIIGEIITIGLAIFTIIFFILVVYGGIIWLTAGGDSAKADKAREILTSASLGVIIIIIAYLLTNFIIFKLIGITINNPA